MTLRETILAVKPSGIPCDELLAQLPICNLDELKVIELVDYILSSRFVEDMDNAIWDVQEAMDHGISDLFLYIDVSSGEYELKVSSIPSLDCIELYEQ